MRTERNSQIIVVQAESCRSQLCPRKGRWASQGPLARVWDVTGIDVHHSLIHSFTHSPLHLLLMPRPAKLNLLLSLKSVKLLQSLGHSICHCFCLPLNNHIHLLVSFNWVISHLLHEAVASFLRMTPLFRAALLPGPCLCVELATLHYGQRLVCVPTNPELIVLPTPCT